MIKKQVKKDNKTPLKYSKNKGYCSVCEMDVLFVEYKSWLRDNYLCTNCMSIPRNRALMVALNKYQPNWRNLLIHESSPSEPLSYYLRAASSNYSSSHYFDNIKRGEYRGDHRSEDLTNLTFKKNSFDIFITSDVFEHVFNAKKAFKEIARVLKPGGIHIFTLPWYPDLHKSSNRAVIKKGKVINIEEPEYHGNPIGGEGSLVSMNWGKDLIDIIYRSSKMTTTVLLQKDKSLGLDGEFLEVFISSKSR